MADKKISALTGATTPLAGTEVLPIVQSGSTVKVSIADVTAGRAVSTGALSVVGANAVLDNTFSLSGKIAAGTAVSMIRRNSSNEVAIDEDGYGTTIGFDNRFNFAGGGNLTIKIGNVIIGTAGQGITTTVTNGDINLIPIGTGVVSSVSDSVFNQIRTARATKTVDRLGTGVLTVTPVSTTSTHSSIRVDINVAFTNSANLQYHAGYLVLTCNQGTDGGGTAIAEYFNGSVGNFVVTSANFVVTRPASGNIVITYTNTNLADPNNIEFAVTGVFAAATVA
jgi:hypothetical protein